MIFAWGNKEKVLKEQLDRVKALEVEKEALAKKVIEIEQRQAVITPGASSVRDTPDNSAFEGIQRSLKVLPADYEFQVVEIIRKLVKINPDVQQAYNDTVKLANTGHKIIFDQSVSPDQIDEMRAFLLESAKNWHVGAGGINGIINKMLRQTLVAGAIANEWVPNLKLDNLQEVRFLHPERIRFVVDKNYTGYQPYQTIKHKDIRKITENELKKLNTNQFRYVALNGDTDVPYGTPPYLSVLDAVHTQRHMIDNIKFIVECLGVLGYIDARIAKPTQSPGESEEAYRARLIQFLGQFKDRVRQGLRDGINVGFEGEHSYDFKATAKTAQGVTELFEQNELLISSSLNYDAAFMGRPGASESLITILFTKMLAQLTNIQELVAGNLEYGYKLALTLGGYKFKNLKVAFNRSTITDDLKYQQADEIKIRNLVVKYQYGLISLEQMADELGYIKPDQKEPRIDITQDDPGGDATKKKKKEDDKNKSDKKGTEKKNPQGKVRRARGDS
jgi:hypothetical protein